MPIRERPYYRTGKISYVEIPASDVAVSAAFYEPAFGWHIRRRDDGSVAFDNTVGEERQLGPRPASEAGLMVHIMVADARKAMESVAAAGGTIVRGVYRQGGEALAAFRAPSGNILGIYQQPGLAEAETAGED